MSQLRYVHGGLREIIENILCCRHESVASVDEISNSQLVSFSIAEDIITLVIAHCNYSLEIGKGTIIDYDFEGLQRQIYEKFIRGRPMLVTKVCIIKLYWTLGKVKKLTGHTLIIFLNKIWQFVQKCN